MDPPQLTAQRKRGRKIWWTATMAQDRIVNPRTQSTQCTNTRRDQPAELLWELNEPGNKHKPGQGYTPPE